MPRRSLDGAVSSPNALAPGIYEADWPRGGPPGAAVPGPNEVLFARRVIEQAMRPTPAPHSKALSDRFDRRVYVKYEHVTPVRSFKCRGALAFISSLTSDERARGVITASTGNHAQGVAWAGKSVGVPVTIVLPRNVAPNKLHALEALEADIRLEGDSLGQAAKDAERQAVAERRVYLEDGENRLLMAGAATVLWEFLEQWPELDTVLLPVGGGNFVAGSLIAAATLKPELRVVGVQSGAATGATESWLAGEQRTAPCTTVAGGLATTHPGALALGVMRELLHAMAIVPEADLWDGIDLLYRATGQVGEHAAVAGLCALGRFGSRIEGEHVGIVITGGHLSADHLARALHGHADKEAVADVVD